MCDLTNYLVRPTDHGLKKNAEEIVLEYLVSSRTAPRASQWILDTSHLGGKQWLPTFRCVPVFELGRPVGKVSRQSIPFRQQQFEGTNITASNGRGRGTEREEEKRVPPPRVSRYRAIVVQLPASVLPYLFGVFLGPRSHPRHMGSTREDFRCTFYRGPLSAGPGTREGTWPATGAAAAAAGATGNLSPAHLTGSLVLHDSL